MSYQSADIRALDGLDPVKLRPGMYTDVARPNHLAHEVIDNSVDGAISGNHEYGVNQNSNYVTRLKKCIAC